VIEIAAEAIRQGRLVAFPTETVYGLGANALDGAAVARIFQAKNRPPSDPVIAHLASGQQLQQVAAQIPTLAWRLAEHFWPGPLTLVLWRQPHVPANLSAGLNTVAVRVPSHPVAQALLQATQLPIGAPSANLFARPSPTTAQHVLEDLGGRIDLILDGGSTPIGLESTVVDLTQPVPVILRPGGLQVEILRQIIPELELSSKSLELETPSPSPGMLLKHYSPSAEIRLFTGPFTQMIAHMQAHARQLLALGKRVGLMLSLEDYLHFAQLPVEFALLGSESDLAQLAASLFAAMRTLDKKQVEVILVRDYGREGLGLAVWDRLLRAAEGRVIDVSKTVSRQDDTTNRNK
jgi:L-threonylcarbamoyladenylate synthase